MLVTIKPNSPKELYIRHMFFPFWSTLHMCFVQSIPTKVLGVNTGQESFVMQQSCLCIYCVAYVTATSASATRHYYLFYVSQPPLYTLFTRLLNTSFYPCYRSGKHFFAPSSQDLKALCFASCMTLI
jgi:hypothetical protein